MVFCCKKWNVLSKGSPQIHQPKKTNEDLRSFASSTVLYAVYVCMYTCCVFHFLVQASGFWVFCLPIQTINKHRLFQAFIQQRDVPAVCLSGLKVNSNLLSETRPIKNAADSKTRQRPRPNQLRCNLPGWTAIYLWLFLPSIQIAICIIIIREHPGLNQEKQTKGFAGLSGELWQVSNGCIPFLYAF